ncbi:olfactory receptor 5M11-like [Discoglossus pictus]
MDLTNQSIVSYFTLRGISDVPELQVPIFLLVLLIYLLTLGGDNTIPRLGCFTQFYVFASLTASELYILTAMSYDRYVAIYNPLNYNNVMNWRVCVLLASFCWLLGFLETTPYFILLSNFTCYLSREINHFFCDIGPIVRITCSDTHFLDLSFLIVTTFLAICPPLLTFTSYVFIIFTILKIKSSTGRSKAFYTCSSHLTVVVLLYVTLICQYVKPDLKDSSQSNKFVSLFNTAAVPMLNPIIYSLKNEDVKSALRRRIRYPVVLERLEVIGESGIGHHLPTKRNKTSVTEICSNDSHPDWIPDRSRPSPQNLPIVEDEDCGHSLDVAQESSQDDAEFPDCEPLKAPTESECGEPSVVWVLGAEEHVKGGSGWGLYKT